MLNELVRERRTNTDKPLSYAVKKPSWGITNAQGQRNNEQENRFREGNLPLRVVAGRG